VANRNATLNAAPDPQAAAREAQRLFNEYLAKTQRVGGGGVSYSGGGGGAPRNANSTAAFMATPWADFQPEAVRGTGAPSYYAGTGINWGNQGPSPQDLWGGAGTGGATDYWNDWFGFDNSTDQPDYGYLDEWGAGG